MAELSVVIVTYNAKAYLVKCLECVRSASVGMDVEIMVVDNASTDGSKDAVLEAFPAIDYIYNTENLGFA
ncbi:MAG: glycosyltransferase, partial [Paludibacteraceae bacterium]|nr:glycosyltransferase [Paludibacteraceae bacterium]